MAASIPGSTPETNLREAPLPAGTLRVLQLTDTHLYASPGGTLLGLNTLRSFQQVVAHVRDFHWPLDLLLATGDLVRPRRHEIAAALSRVRTLEVLRG